MDLIKWQCKDCKLLFDSKLLAISHACKDLTFQDLIETTPISDMMVDGIICINHISYRVSTLYNRLERCLDLPPALRS